MPSSTPLLLLAVDDSSLLLLLLLLVVLVVLVVLPSFFFFFRFRRFLTGTLVPSGPDKLRTPVPNSPDERRPRVESDRRRAGEARPLGRPGGEGRGVRTRLLKPSPTPRPRPVLESLGLSVLWKEERAIGVCGVRGDGRGMELRWFGERGRGTLEEREEREERGRGFVGEGEGPAGERRSLVEWRWGRAIGMILCWKGL